MTRTDWPSCRCSGRCQCALGIHSYVEPYTKIIEIIRPWIVYEWGPGKNTQIALRSGARVTSVEHNLKFCPKPEPGLVIKLTVLDIQYTKVEPADLYFVDGRMRAECLDRIKDLGSPSAVVCLHDAQRMRYHAALARFDRVVFLQKDFAVAGPRNKVDEIAAKIPVKPWLDQDAVR